MFKTLPDGRVELDATPVEFPTRLRLPQNRASQIRDFIRQELSIRAASEGHESFEEADDFSLDDDEPMTPYELACLDGEVAQFYHDVVKPRIDARNAGAALSASSANGASNSGDADPVSADKGDGNVSSGS